ncbi:MAG: hypothetical protein ACPF9D_10540, partial [Owenweeksia sp.]
MKNIFLIPGILITLAFSSCKTKKPVFEKHSYTVLEQQMKFNMLHLPVKKAGKMALIIPSPFNHTYDQLARSLNRWGYTIVVAPTYEDIALLDKRSWSEGIIITYQKMVDDSLIPPDPDNFLIMGLGEGGYVLPEVCKRLKPDLFMAVASGSHSPLEEILLALGDTTVDTKAFVKAYDAIDEEELFIKTGILLREPYRDAQL